MGFQNKLRFADLVPSFIVYTGIMSHPLVRMLLANKIESFPRNMEAATVSLLEMSVAWLCWAPLQSQVTGLEQIKDTKYRSHLHSSSGIAIQGIECLHNSQATSIYRMRRQRWQSACRRTGFLYSQAHLIAEQSYGCLCSLGLTKAHHGNSSPD